MCSLDGPRKKIYLGCEVCSTWELSLITREGKRGASDCLISGSSVSKPKARLRASKSGKLRAEGKGKGQYLAAGSINSAPDFWLVPERLAIRKRWKRVLGREFELISVVQFKFCTFLFSVIFVLCHSIGEELGSFIFRCC